MGKPRLEVAVGLFVVIGFLILSMLVFFVSGVYIFRPGYHLTAVFEYVGIINRGAPVRFAGVRVGEVSQIEILEPVDVHGNTKVAMTFFIEEGIEVKEHYEISVRGTHIMSEPHIEITPKPGEGRLLKDGDVIENGVSPVALDILIQRGDQISKKMEELLKGAGSILEDAEIRELLKKSVASMARVVIAMDTIMSGQEEDFRALVVNLSRATQEMADVLEKINQAEGTLGKLVVEDEIYNELNDFVREIKTHPWRLLKKK